MKVHYLESSIIYVDEWSDSVSNIVERHRTIALCGIDTHRFSKDKNKVSCKACIRLLLERKKIN